MTIKQSNMQRLADAQHQEADCILQVARGSLFSLHGNCNFILSYYTVDQWDCIMGSKSGTSSFNPHVLKSVSEDVDRIMNTLSSDIKYITHVTWSKEPGWINNVVQVHYQKDTPCKASRLDSIHLIQLLKLLPGSGVPRYEQHGQDVVAQLNAKVHHAQQAAASRSKPC
jgi:hypothetical protein